VDLVASLLVFVGPLCISARYRHISSDQDIEKGSLAAGGMMQAPQTPTAPNLRRRARTNSPVVSADTPWQGVFADEASSACSSKGADSMRPLAPPARKRRKTILDAFSSIHIQTEEEEDDADSSQAVADIDEEDVSDSTLGDDESQGERFLSDREEAERKVMLQLVLGHRKIAEAQDPVDRKVTAMVRETIKQVIVPPRPASAKDDMTIDASYNTRSSSLMEGGTLERSNSLPDMSSLDGDSMDISMV
jgi:hypothetical protein